MLTVLWKNIYFPEEKIFERGRKNIAKKGKSGKNLVKISKYN